MKIADLRQKTDDELKSQLLDLRKEQFNLRFQAANEQVQNTMRIRQVRRDIARVKTLMNQKTVSQI